MLDRRDGDTGLIGQRRAQLNLGDEIAARDDLIVDTGTVGAAEADSRTGSSRLHHDPRARATVNANARAHDREVDGLLILNTAHGNIQVYGA